MEKGGRNTGFFFRNAISRLDTFFEISKKRFTHLFGDSGKGRKNTPGASYKRIVFEGIREREAQIHWLADSDPVKIEKYFKMPLFELWTILDNRLALEEKLKQKQKKK